MNIEDIVDHMLKVDQQEKSQLFNMPWDYIIKPFTTDTEYHADIIEKEITTDMDAKQSNSFISFRLSSLEIEKI